MSDETQAAPEFEPEFSEEGPAQQISFGVIQHPLTGEPLLVLMAKDGDGNRIALKLNTSEALQLGANITSQATVIMTLVAQANQQAQTQQPRLVVPGR